MAISLLRLLGARVAHKTLAHHSHPGGVLDIKFGFAMLKDRRVPFKSKLLAVGLGAGLVAALIGLQLPLEALVATVVPILGFMADILTDGLEAVIGTIGLASILLPYLAPKLLTQQLRNERDGVVEAVFTPTPTPAPVPPTYANYDMPAPPQRLITPQH